MKSSVSIGIAALILVKIVLGSVFVYRIESDSFLFDNSALAAETSGNADSPPVDGNTDAAPETETIDMAFILKERAELEAREEMLDKKQEELETIQKEVQKKLDTISKLRKEISAQEGKQRTLEDQRSKQKIKHLIKAYSAMKPQRAAGLIEKLNTDFSIQLLSQMKGDVVGKILTFVDLDKAARISEGLVNSK